MAISYLRISEALASIEASAAFLSESSTAQDMSADDLRTELAQIRDIARAALGIERE